MTASSRQPGTAGRTERQMLMLIIGQKKVRGSQILQQKALQLYAGKVGQTSYTKILQDRFGIVKKFYKQQEGLTDKGMISPMEKSPIRTKTALERS